jgi:hypothetical protein
MDLRAHLKRSHNHVYVDAPVVEFSAKASLGGAAAERPAPHAVRSKNAAAAMVGAHLIGFGFSRVCQVR